MSIRKILHNMRVAQQISNPVDPTIKLVGASSIVNGGEQSGFILPPTYARTVGIFNRSSFYIGLSIDSPATITNMAKIIGPGLEGFISFAGGAPTLSYVYLPTDPKQSTPPTPSALTDSVLVVSYYIP